MNRLYLVRHGIAFPHGDLDYSEDARPLTPEGEKHIYQVARGLRRLKVKVDRIVTSPMVRASRTAELIANSLGLDTLLEVDDALRAEHTAESIRDWLRDRPEARLMIVGHNPSFSELAGLLLTDVHPLPTITMRKGSVAAFVGDAEGAWHLDWFARPKLLRNG